MLSNLKSSMSSVSEPKLDYANPRIVIVSDSFDSSDDDPFASREEDRALLMRKVSEKLIKVQEHISDEGQAEWSLLEAQNKLVKRRLDVDVIQRHDLRVMKMSDKYINHSNAI